MADPRPGWDDYFLGIAEAVAARADCTRRRIGALIVDQRHRIVATGYNGAPARQLGCLSGGCPRGRHYRKNVLTTPMTYACACTNPWPCPDAVDHGASYDTGPGACVALHAEQNAIMYAGRDGCEGSTMYITDSPCDGCHRMIEASGLIRVRAPRLYWDL